MHDDTMKNRFERCIYCGGTNSITHDHIPPKNLFEYPFPNNLITVPCCRECHKPTSKDDEYFRDMLTMRNDTFEHPAVQSVIKKVLRSFERPQKRESFNSILQSIKNFEIVTKGGIYLGNGSTYEVDISRLDRVIERVVRGLYWKESKELFPINGKIRSYTIDALNLKEPVINKICATLSNSKEKVVGKNTFSYKRARSVDIYYELWFLMFYQKVGFLVFTQP